MSAKVQDNPVARLLGARIFQDKLIEQQGM